MTQLYALSQTDIVQQLAEVYTGELSDFESGLLVPDRLVLVISETWIY